MPSKKIYILTIISFAFIISFWIIYKDNKNSIKNSNSGNLIAINVANSEMNENWKEIIETVVNNNNTPTIANNSGEFENTTLTSNLALDIFSNYLVNAKKDPNISNEDASRIVSEVLNSSTYDRTKTKNLYTENNLNIINSNSKETLDQYKNELNTILKSGIASLGNSKNIGDIIHESYIKQDSKKSQELEKFLIVSKEIKNGLLEMGVPKELSILHLRLLNSANDIQNDLESAFSYPNDPVRGFLGINSYQSNYEIFLNSLQSINIHFLKNN